MRFSSSENGYFDFDSDPDFRRMIASYRILIIPWPPFTDAFKKDRFKKDVTKGSDIISGKSII